MPCLLKENKGGEIGKSPLPEKGAGRMGIDGCHPLFGIIALQVIKPPADFFELFRHEVGLGLEKSFFRVRIGLEGR